MDGSWIWPLACSLMMVVMMFGMRGGGHKHHTQASQMQTDYESRNHQDHQIKADGHCSSHHHQAKRHNWMMLLYCVLPVVLVAAALVVGRFSGASMNILPLLWVLICPLSHFFLMPFIMGEKKR
ncbi:hypothetical protein ACFQ3W_16740 [Paenibacillus puldeungensis]|uniref:DUF2933 domain-containing protein n=1 Tax=Paenibacillus puldeungensis TaxID=696536 RepID=A0ABW3S1B6_9BACL